MAYTVALTVASGKVASDLTNAPVLVDLSGLPTAWWTDTTSDLGNVRVKLDGTEIPVHVVWYDRTARTGMLVFRASTLAAATATVVTVETVDGATALAATDPNGRNAVWSSVYKAMYVGSNVDASGQSPDATILGSGSWSNGWFNFGAAASALHVSGMAHSTTFAMGGTFIRSASDTATGTNRTLLTYTVQDSTNDAHRATLSNDNASRPGLWNSTNSWLYGALAGFWTSGSRHKVVGYQSGTTGRGLSLDGAAYTSLGTSSARPTAGSAASFYVGQDDGSNGSRFYGTGSFFYVRHAVPTAAWVAFEQASWESPSTFYTLEWPPVGPMDSALPALSADGTGYVQPFGTMAGTLPALDAAFGGAPAGGPVNGSLDATLPGLATTTDGTVDNDVPFTPRGFGWSWRIDMTADVDPPADPDMVLVPRPIVAVSAPTPTLVDGRPV